MSDILLLHHALLWECVNMGVCDYHFSHNIFMRFTQILKAQCFVKDDSKKNLEGTPRIIVQYCKLNYHTTQTEYTYVHTV